MANLVDLGCKCGARGGDPSENSHYMIIHHFASPIAIVQLWIVLLYWAKAWCLYSGRKLPKYILSSKRENFSKRFKWNCTNCRIMSTVQHCCRAWLSGEQIMQKMIILALCRRPEKFRSGRCQQLARSHLHITPIQTRDGHAYAAIAVSCRLCAHI